jgi:hypothetical protein
MAIYLRAEIETEVHGDGDGFITITQTDSNGEKTEIYLTVHQFETIFNHEKHIVREAFGTE